MAFIATHELTPWQPPSPEQKALRELTRARHQLVAQSRQLRQQLLTTGAAARPYLAQVLATLKAQIATLETQRRATSARTLCACAGLTPSAGNPASPRDAPACPAKATLTSGRLSTCPRS